EAHENAADMQSRAATFVSAEKELHTVDEVLAGVGHLIAERIGDYAELRGRLRRIFQRSGKVVCTKVEAPIAAPVTTTAVQAELTPAPVSNGAASDGESGEGGEGATASNGVESEHKTAAVDFAEAQTAVETETTVASEAASAATVVMSPAHWKAMAQETVAETQSEVDDPSPETSPPLPPAPTPIPESSSNSASAPASESPQGVLPAGRLFEAPATPVAAPLAAVLKKKKKKKKKIVGEHAFKDYYNYSEPLGKVPPHRVLAMNRGERAHAIRVKFEFDTDAMLREAEQYVVRPDHPHGEYLRGCVRDSLIRLIQPSLEREIRREMTDKAEQHAVEVFIRNLRKLLLQPPTRGRRVLAIDPGFKSGSKMAALDEFGNVLGLGMVFVIGKDEERRKKTRQRLADMVKQHNVSVVAIGNGTGCRETEQLVADVLAEELKDRDVAYVVVNEAGASIYSTSPLGREELPQHDALQRGAISIGRRLLDPLSEMVKINPANLGVGLYQHDIKAKHLKDSLDAVVESAVNFVGVDVNSASPALLRYVSGMNALTARRVYEYRREKGPFKNRDELKQVPGFGEQTFVQAAGFLKVIGGENPLDATWIHPESYDVARQVLEKLGLDEEALARAVPGPVKKEEKKEFAAELVDAPSPPVETVSSTPAAVQEGEGGRAGEGETEFVAGSGSAATVVMSPAELVALRSPPPETHEEPSSATLAESNIHSTATPTPPVDSQPAADAQPAPAQADDGHALARREIADRANQIDVPKLAVELGIGWHLLDDILMSMCRPGIDPRDSLAAPVFRRGIMKLEDLSPGMELSGTVLNVVDFGVFVDIGLSDSGLVHISRLADRYIRDPHEVVGVGDVLHVWVVEVDKNRRRVSLTAIRPGSERPHHGPRDRGGQQRPPKQQEQRPPRPPRQPAGGRPQQTGAQPAGAGAGAQGQDQRPPRPQGGGGRRDSRRGGRPASSHPQTIERAPTKPKKFKPITKAQEEGKEPMRSFSDLMQLFDKKKKKPEDGEGASESPPA
ncbi:MAG: helix-hairpin-helix domain-containing protein, partial [Planctomycetaceae bacterium]|nr:helix-hairpin-helix domain-containing protein [Planctomycetaceae bacterium]